MSPSHILEPTYQALKERLLAGHWPAGFRLDTARLADDLGVSKSPVRDSLNRLAGEHLVEFEPGQGYHVPRLDERRLLDLYDLNLLLIFGALRDGIVPLATGAPVDREPAILAAWCFSRIGQLSGNAELLAAILGMNDRLAPARHLEAVLIADPMADLIALEVALTAGVDGSIIRQIVTQYHELRKLEAGRFVAKLARGLDHR